MRSAAPTSPAPADADRAAYPVEGDDIGRARGFIDVAGVAMGEIIHASRETESCNGRCAHYLSQRLSTIQSGAKRARARAVYRSAQEALSAIQSRGPHLPIDWTRVDGRLLVLNKLIGQFEGGVIEMEEAFALRADPRASHADRPAASNDSTRDTLHSLLPHAGEAERASLLRLIRWRDRAGLPSERNEPAAPEAPSEPQFALSDSMAAHIQDWLGTGRDFGKSISVSYALDDVMMSQPARDDMLARLDARIEACIASDMPLQGVGHLDITADAEALKISGSGFAPFRLDFEDSRPTPKRAPMITDETEEQLRAQLQALLDPAALDQAGIG